MSKLEYIELNQSDFEDFTRDIVESFRYSLFANKDTDSDNKNPDNEGDKNKHH